MSRRLIDYQTLVGYLLLFSGSLIALWLFWALLNGLQTLQWHESTGLIYESEIIYSTSNPADKDRPVYSTHISYKYQVGGITLSNTQVYQTDIPFIGGERAAALVAEYPVGSIRPVFYDPRNPEESALIKGISNTLILFIAPTLLFLIIGFRLVKRTPDRR